MKRIAAALVLLALTAPLYAADLAQWNRILTAYYDPAQGLDYKALKARDAATVQAVRQALGKVNVAALTPKQQLAHWINVYNVNTVATILENYPVKSIRDISTDPIIRLNVFKKDRIPVGGAKMSLNDVENDKIRAGFKDPRIHFAINCAAKSCPPLRTEAYVGERLDAQLDDQTRKFLTGPRGVRFRRDGDTLVITTTKIMDWFGEDFDKWGGGRTAFIRKYIPADKQQMIDQAKKVELRYDDYDWSLNDWRR
ncbi:MAG TPA: DUF547 domain-containing protein [Thermoanaerobaculia bacterium]|nr:DUF547 domain-containing protein [Thermoanaerobaculia bacterium]